MNATAPVSAAICTRKPNIDHLSRTLQSIRRQETPPAEVVLVDSTPDGPPIGGEHYSAIHYEPVANALSGLSAEGVDVVTAEAGIGTQRRVGVEESSQPYIVHLDEDAVLLNRHHFDIALERLDDPDVAAVGGPVEPIEEGPLSNAIASAEHATPYVRCTHYLTHERRLCDDVTRCFPNDHRGNDIKLRSHLRSHGHIVRDPRLVCLKDLPTNRQKKYLTASAIGAGVVLMAI